MNKFLNFIFILFFVVSCKPKNSDLNTTESQSFKRIMGKKSWGFVNQDGDTVIPLNKYNFLNPIDEEGMILAQSNEKSGYINIVQDTLIPFKYEDLSVFSNGLAPAKLKGKYGFIDRKGNVVIPFEYETESHFYKCGLAKAQKNNGSGFIDKTGKVIIPLEFEKVRYNKADQLVCAMKNGKWAFFSCEGKQLTEFEFDQITESPYSESSYTYFESGLCRVTKNGKQGYIDSSFEMVIPFGKYEESQPFDLAKRAVVKTKGKYGLINTSDKFVLEPKFESIEYFNYPSGRYKVMYDNKYGIVDSLGQQILPTQYLEITPNYFQLDTLRKGILILKRNIGKTSVTDYDGKVIISEKYDDIGIFEVHQNVSYSIVRKKGRYGLINHLDEILLPVENDFIERRRWFNYLIVKNNGFQGLFSKNGKEIFQKKYEQINPCHYDDNERFIVKQNGLFGIIDIKENEIIPIEYEEISNWVEYGPKEHFVTKNGKKGLVSRDGKIVIPTQYDEIFVDNSTLIKVKNDGLYGTVDWNNKIVHPIKYEQILWEWPYLTQKPLDTIYVKENGKYLSMDKSGKVIESMVSKKLIDEKFGYLLEYE
ncbi:WG repeat-containing protein [Flavobacteriaceae bacterium 3-367]|uniref:WG repeat-containing protein n=1 Tax=Eudoraea algarum TaxID=3417568 RepID=UPI00328DAFB6